MRRILLLTLLLVGAFAVAGEDPNAKLFEAHSRLAAKGVAEAQFKLAEMYEEGRGTAVNLDKSREWYELAAKQGHEEAQNRLTTLGTRRSADDAARLAREAAEAKQRAEEERQAAAAQRRAEEERQAASDRARAAAERERQAKQRSEEEQARQLQAQRRAEEEQARQAAAEKRRAEEQRARQGTTAAPAAAGDSPKATPSTEKPTDRAAGQESFESDPCKGPAARFLSTCR